MTVPALRRLVGVIVPIAVVLGVLTPATQAPPAKAAAATAVVEGEAVSLGNLEVERKVAPLGIDVARPRFSWVIESATRGTEQEAYQIQVATSESALDDGDLVWDSGVVRSDASYDVAYDGPALEPATDYHWRVEARTSAGRAQADSTFRTGLFDEGDWANSAWIGNDRVQRSDDAATLEGASWIHLPYSGGDTPPGYFRKRFTTEPGKTIQDAELVMAADMGFSAHLNGSQVASRPAVEDAWRTGTRVDVRPVEGANLLAVRMNNAAKANGAAVGKLRIHYTDGSVQDVVTDATWKAIGTATTGWHLADHDDSGWVSAAARTEYGGSPWGTNVSLPAERRTDTGMNFDTASWILPPIGQPTSGNPIPSTVFRREIEVPAGKQVAWAQLAVTGDQVFKAYWNGAQVAFNTGANNEWQQARRVNLPTPTGENVLGLELITPGTSQNGGVLARVRIGYTDGTTEDVVSDASFSALQHGTDPAPAGWADRGFDDSAWPSAQEQVLYRGGVYGDRVTVPALEVGSAELSLANASWIWTAEADAPRAPAEPRAFRFVHETPAGLEATSAEVLITGDDSFRLWANGAFVGGTQGETNEWQTARRYQMDLAADRNVFAVRTTNTLEGSGAQSPAGLLAAVRVHYSDGSTEDLATGADWLASRAVPNDFHHPDLDDAGWAQAAVLAPYGSGPWGSRVTVEEQVSPAPLLRKEFDVTGEVADATLFVAAGGYAYPSLNGAPVNDEVLSPGFTDYDDTVQYVATDVTEQLSEGANAIGMELGRGFYGMTGGNVWNWQSPPWHDEPVVRALLRIKYADGTVDQVVTDDSWTVHDGPTVFDDLYAGETYNAALTQGGFDTAGFEDDRWPTASEVRGPRGELVNQRQQPIRVTEELPAVDVAEPIDGTYVVRFPRVLAGWVEVTATGEAGTQVELRYAEKLRADGTVNQSNNGGFQKGFQTDRFLLAGAGEQETWEPKFSYKGFQYVQVTGWPGDEPPPLDAFTAKAVHTDAPETGSFETSNEIMNKTHRAVVDTLENNIHSIPTDTPMFEKNGWTGDAAVGAEMFMLNLDTHELFAKWIRDVHETRDENGAPLVIAPSSDQWGQWGLAQPWHSAYVLVPYWLYQYGGDRQVLEQHYAGIKAYVDLEFNRSNGGIVASNRLGDWVSPEASPAGGNAPEDTKVSGTAFLYTMLTTMERAADLLGRPRDGAHFAERAATVKAAFNNAYLDQAQGYYRGQSGDQGYRQTHNVLALAFGLAPDAETEQQVADSIAADVEARGNHLNTGVLGTKYLLPVLTDHGYADLAYDLAVQTSYPSWGHMIENGATSMWEHWSPEARSLGHYFLGTVDDWFYRYVAGIRPSEEHGYRRTTIAPTLDDELTDAAATTSTPLGPVTSAWERGDDLVSVDVTVPVGIRATVVLPTSSAWAATESGDPLESADGIQDVRVVDGSVEVRVGSGSYEFQIADSAGLIGTVLDRIQELVDTVEDLRESGAIDRALARDLLTRLGSARAAALDALDVAADDPVEAAESLTLVIEDLDRLDDVVAAATVADADRTTLEAGSLSVRDAVGVAIGDLLQVGFDAAVPAGKVKPGGEVQVTLDAENGGTASLRSVAGTLTGPDEAWQITPARAAIADELAGGEDASATALVTVPPAAAKGPARVEVRVSYVFEGVEVQLRDSVQVEVDAPVVVTSSSVTPTPARPGSEVQVEVVLHNQGKAPVAGEVRLEVPDGWPQPGPAVVRMRAGETGAVRIPVRVPRDAPQAQRDAQLQAVFAMGDADVAEGDVIVPVAIEPEPDVYDHVDLGDTASEEAHALTASPSSGTNTEAGLTRRYAGHLTAFSFFEFDVAVTPGEPFVLRATETYDRAQTKRYKVYVDGEQVLLRSFAHQGGVGTETYEALVPAELATADTVRVRFENQGDPSYYDPSIADVWTLPYAAPADDLEPMVPPSVTGRPSLDGVLTATPGEWNAEGLEFAYQWLRDGLVLPGATAATYQVGAADLDRDLAVQVTATRDGSWPARAVSDAVTPARAGAAVALTLGKRKLRKGVRVRIVARVVSEVSVDGAPVRVLVDGRRVARVEIDGRVARHRLVLRKRGWHRVQVVFPGTPGVAPAESKVRRVRVR